MSDSRRMVLDSCLQALGIEPIKHSHIALHDTKVADQHGVERAGIRLKNLFLRDNYGRRHFLLLTSPDKQINLKQLSKDLGISRLGFASTERLARYLDVKPGHVSLLALINAVESTVELLVDQSIWHANGFQCHPLINTETYVLTKDDLLTFLQHLKVQYQLVKVPEIAVKS